MKVSIYIFVLVLISSIFCCNKDSNEDSYIGRYKCKNTKIRFITPTGSNPYSDTNVFYNFQDIKSIKNSIYSIDYYLDSFKLLSFQYEFIKESDSIFEYPKYYLGASGKLFKDSFSIIKPNIDGSATRTIYESTYCNCKKIK